MMDGDLDQIRGFLRESLGHEGDIDPNIDLLEEGILDSFNVVEVALFIQEHFGIELEGEDVTRENFARLRDMVALIDRRRNAH